MKLPFRIPFLVLFCGFLLAVSGLHAQDTARGTTSDRSPVTQAGKTRAVIVGISDYRNLPPSRQLDYADRDAELFHNYLQLTRKPAATRIFLNAEATSSRIMMAVDEMITASQSGDELIFYFAGHGDVAKDKTKDQDDAYLLCTDVSTDADYGLSDAISLSRLQTLIADAARKGVQVNLITDACRSGKVATTEEAAYSTAYIISQKWEKVMKLASCQENELSYESVKWGNGHGVFTYYLVRGLSKEADVSPKDNNVTLKELELYIKKEVSEATGEGQNPIKVGGDARKVFGSLLSEDLMDAAFVIPKMETLLASRNTEGQFNSAELDLVYGRFKSFVRSGKVHDSAYQAYLDFAGKDTAKKYAQLLKNELILELIASSQRLIDKYMEGGNDMPSSGKFDKAAKEMDLAVKLYGRRNSISQLWTSKQLFLQAFTYIRGERREKYAEAAALLNKALKGNKKAAYIHQAFGRMYNDLGDYRKSEKYLLEAIRLAPRWTYPRSDLGNTYRDMLNWTKSEQVFEEALAIDPSLARLYNNLSNIYFDQGKLSQSEKLYLKADSLAPNTAVYFSNLGMVHLNQGRKSSALAMYNKALSLDSNFYHTYEKLANYYLEEKKEYDRGAHAFRYIQKALEIEPYYFEGYNLLGDYYFTFDRTRQDLQKGIDAYRKAIELNHRDVDSYYDMAYQLMARLKDTVRAEAVIAEMLKKNPGSTSAWYNKGAFEEDRGNHAEAEKWYRKALKANPYEFYVYTQLSGLLEKKGRLKEAEDILLQSLPYYSNAPERLYNIANFYIRYGNTKEAVRYYQQCLAVDSSYSYAWSSLSYVLLQSNAPAKEIRNAFDKARALNPFLHKPESFASMLKMQADSLNLAKADPSLIISFLEEAMSLDPAKKDVYLLEIARVHYFAGNNQIALSALEMIGDKPSHFVKQGVISLQWKISLENKEFDKANALILQEMSGSPFPSHLGNALSASLSGNFSEAKNLIETERKENPTNLREENLKKKFNNYLLTEINKLLQQ